MTDKGMSGIVKREEHEVADNGAWDNVLKDTTGRPIFLVKDRDGIAVFLSREVWYEHILSRHPEVDGYKNLILQAIENPDVRQIDPEEKRVRLCYKNVPEDERPFRKALYLRVVIKYLHPEEREGEKTGLISSVYFVDHVKRGKMG